MKSTRQMFFSKSLLSLVLTGCIFVVQGTAWSEMLSVQGDKVQLRANPDTKAKVKWELGDGYPMEVIKREGDWVLAKDFENDSGWILKSRLQKNQHVIVKANKNQEMTINIRRGPTTDEPIVGKAHYGVVFTVQEKKGDWLRVRHESGLTGWIKSDLVWGQ
jgi:SH3-like domain-containing protein